MVYIGYGENGVLLEVNMYFYRVSLCYSVAREVVKRYSTHGITLKDRVVAYCVPKYLEGMPENVY